MASRIFAFVGVGASLVVGAHATPSTFGGSKSALRIPTPTGDPAKDEVNRFKHGVPLSFGRRVFEDVGHVIVASPRPIDGEDRCKAIGKVDGRLWTATHVWRDDICRLISVRRSNSGEQRNYDRDPQGSG